MRYMVHVLSNRACMVIERHHPNFHPHYADFRVMFADGVYRIIRLRHLREAMAGEIRAFTRERSLFGGAA